VQENCFGQGPVLGDESGPEWKTSIPRCGPNNATPKHCAIVQTVKNYHCSGVPWEEGCETAHERKSEKYTELMTTCRGKGLSTWLFPVEVGCRGFPAQSVWWMMQTMEIVGRTRKVAIRQLGEAAEGSSCWLWHRRDDLGWKPSVDE